jgi:hypothetical protein
MAISTNLYIDQGTDFSVSVNISETDGTAKNLSGYTARAQLRKSYYSKTNVTFTSAVTAPSEGEITISLSNAQTANIKAGRYVFDVETVSNANVIARILEGMVIINPEVTR